MKKKQLGTISLICLLFFIGIAVWTFSPGGFPPDRWMLNWVEEIDGGALFTVMAWISLLGSGESILILIFTITLLLLYGRNWQLVLLFLTVSVGGVVVNSLLKFLFHRERPGEMHIIEVFNQSFNIPSYSFPSGHAMRSTILLCFVMYLIHTYLRKSAFQYSLYALSLFFMISIALSRVLLDAHYVSDVLGAMSISIVWFCSVRYVYLAGKEGTERLRT